MAMAMLKAGEAVKTQMKARSKGLFESVGSSVEGAGILTSLGHGIDSFLGLNDPTAEEQVGLHDRVSIGGAGYLTSVDQSSITPSSLGTIQKEDLKSSVDKPGTKQTQGERFFLIHTQEWTTSTVLYSKLFDLDVVKLLTDEEFSVDGLLRFHTYARFGVDIIVQMNPTNFQQGGILVALIPSDKAQTSSANLTTFCHGKMNCNINNMCRLIVPFVYSRGMYNVRKPEYPIWKLYCMVLSQLKTGTGTSPSVSINVLARLTNLQMHGLAPIIKTATRAQMMRNEVRITSSQNVLNLSNGEDSRAKISFALGQEHELSDTSSAGGLSIDDLSTWTTIPCIAYQFDFNSSAAAGTQIFTTTCEPFSFNTVENFPAKTQASSSTNLAHVASQFLYWRGDIVFDFHVFPTKFHSGRLLVLFYPGNEETDVSAITIKQASTGMVALFDITGVNSTLRFRVPFVSDTPYKMNKYHATQYTNYWSATGKIIVFVYNKLTNPSNVSSSVNVVVYKSAENLELFVPVYRIYEKDQARAQMMSPDEYQKLQDTVAEIKADPPREIRGGFSSVNPTQQRQIDKDSDPLNPLGSSKQLKVTPFGATTAMEDPKLEKSTPGTFPEEKPGTSRHTGNHMNILKLMSRGHWMTRYNLTSSPSVVSFPISVATYDATSNENQGGPLLYPETPTGTLIWFLQMFQIYRGPIDITLAFVGYNDVEGAAWFTPFGMNVEGVNTAKAPSFTQSTTAALGLVRFNTSRTGNVQVRVPFYTSLVGLATVGPVNEGLIGHLSIQISHLTAAEEPLGVTLYWSFTEESQFLYPRGCPAADFVTDVSSVNLKDPPPHIALMQMGMPESSVDQVQYHDHDDPIFNEIHEKIDPRTYPLDNHVGNKIFRSGQVSKNPYKELRLEVGEKRLEQAFEHLRRPLGPPDTKRPVEKNHLQKTIAKAQCSDCRPKIGDIMVCKVETGKHFGIFTSKGVFHVNPEGKKWFMSRTAICKYSSNLLKWCVHGPGKIDPQVVEMACSLLDGKSVSYDIFTRNCESYANGITSGEYESKEGKIWKAVLVLLGTTSLSVFFECIRHEVDESVLNKVTGKLARQLSDTPVADKANRSLDELKQIMAEMRTKLSDVIHKIFPGKSASKYLKWTLKIFKLLVSFSIIHMSGYCGKTIAAVIAYTGLDFLEHANETQQRVQRALEGMFEEVEMDDATVAQASMRDMLTGVMLFKNIKDLVIWLYGKMAELIDKITGKKDKVFQCLVDQNIEIMMMVAEADTLFSTVVTEANKAALQGDIFQLLTRLRTVHVQIYDSDLKRHTWPITNAITLLQRKLKELGTVNTSVVCRPEPTVCFLYGPRGSGKSLLSIAVAGGLCKAAGVDATANIYTKPIGSDYWDGYNNQLVCIIDDIGQSTDDEDWTDFCQLVSSCPMRLNMANLEQKGMHFTSPFIICTSNLEEPKPKTIYHSEAVERRLHFKLHVMAQQKYVTEKHGIPVLDVEKATKDGTFLSLDCLEIKWNHVQKIRPDQIIQMMHDRYEDNSKLSDDLLKAWSQKGESYTLAEFLGSRKLEIVPRMDPSKFTEQWSLWNAIKTHKYWILGVISGLLGVCTLGIASYHMFKNSKRDDDDKQERAYSGRIVKKDPIIKLGGQTVHQSTLDVTKIVQQNLVAFGYGENEDDINWTVCGLGIKDEYILVPSHGYTPATQSSYFFFEKHGVIYSCSRERIQEIVFEEHYSDVVLLRVPTMPKFRDILKHFIQLDQLHIVEGKPAILSTLHYGNNMLITEGNLEYREKYSYLIGRDEEVTVSDTFRAKAFTQDGMCGGAVVSSSNKTQNAIAGIHVAAGQGYAVTKIVFKEHLESVLEAATKAQRIWKVEDCGVNISQPNKSEYSKSPLYEYISKKDLKQPAALLNSHCEIDPSVVMLSKYESPLVSEPPGYEEVVLQYSNKLECALQPEKRVLTEREAIEGIDGMEGIDMKTSPGIPYVFEKIKKRDIVQDGKLIGLAAELRDEIEEKCFSNGQINIIFNTTAKDELRPADKVKISKTRAIHAAPLHFVVLFRQLFGTAISALQLAFGFLTHIAVGIFPESDWDRMGHELFSKCHWGLDLDFKNFDASLSPFMIKRAIQVLGSLSGVCSRTCDKISEPIRESVNQIGSIRYYVRGGMPSGAPATSIINSIVNVTNTYYVLCGIFNLSLWELASKIRLIVYGDDIVLCFVKGFLDKPLDQERCCKLLVEGYRRLGLTPTSADKTEVRPTQISDLRFLKRSFRFDEIGKIHPAIEMPTVSSMLAWKTKNATMEDLLEQACWFMFHHGQTKYQSFVSQLKTILKKAGLKFRIPTYGEQNVRFLRDLNCGSMPGD
uniref:Genome polyprotein n=1 Tax=Worm lizard picornavirus TaxID=2961780 RepID=A0A9N6YJW4_9PICO|nr:TPA_asm: polyprotein [Worm lizard picornavirus]